MDGNRFDAIAKTLIAATSRRRTLGGLLGGTLGLLGLADPEEAWSAKSGRCKPKCDKCERCEKGKCRRTKSGKKRCKKGKCVLQPGAPRCGAGEVRNPDTCGCCQTNGQRCSPPGVGNCCSEGCFDVGGGNVICRGRPAGFSCTFGAQCQSGVCSNGICT